MDNGLLTVSVAETEERSGVIGRNGSVRRTRVGVATALHPRRMNEPVSHLRMQGRPCERRVDLDLQGPT